MKGPRSVTRPKAASAARRAAKAPSSKTAKKPQPRKPSPPVFDCLKCSKLTAEKREVTRLRRELERLVGLEQARVDLALAGGPVCLSDEEINSAIQRVYVPGFEEVLRVALTIALSPVEDAQDRLKAVAMIAERVAGKVTDKHELSTKDGAPIYLIPGLPQPVADLPGAADQANPEQSEGSGA